LISVSFIGTKVHANVFASACTGKLPNEDKVDARRVEFNEERGYLIS
jgi:hypothetical protein